MYLSDGKSRKSWLLGDACCQQTRPWTSKGADSLSSLLANNAFDDPLWQRLHLCQSNEVQTALLTYTPLIHDDFSNITTCKIKELIQPLQSSAISHHGKPMQPSFAEGPSHTYPRSRKPIAPSPQKGANKYDLNRPYTDLPLSSIYNLSLQRWPAHNYLNSLQPTTRRLFLCSTSAAMVVSLSTP